MNRPQKCNSVTIGAIILCFVTMPFRTCIGQVGQHSILTNKPVKEGDRWALVIGIQDYSNTSLEQVPYATRDVYAISETLRENCRFPANNVVSLMDHSNQLGLRPTKRNILRQLEHILHRIKEDDTVFVYYSGHGVLVGDRAYLAMGNYTNRNLATTAVSLSELKDKLNSSLARRRIICLDMCHAGSSKTAHQLSIPAEHLEDALKYSRGTITLASTGREQLSYGWKERGLSVFTAHLCDALLGHADFNDSGVVDHSELHQYVVKHVPKTLNGKAQEPRLIVADDVYGLFPIADSISSRSMLNLVKRKRKALFRIERKTDRGNWVYCGTAFAISSKGNRVYLATASEILRHRGAIPENRDIRLIHPSRSYSPTQIYTKFSDHASEDVAILEISMKDSDRRDSLELFNLMASGEKSLLNSSPQCVRLGILENACSPTTSCLSQSRFSKLPSAFSRHIGYKTSKRRYMPGAPLFVISDKSASGTEQSETVVGICVPNKSGDTFAALRVDALWSLYSQLLTENERIELPPGYTSSIGHDTSLQPGNPKPLVIIDKEDSSDWFKLVDIELRSIVDLCRREKYDLADEMQTRLRTKLARAGKSDKIPWELEALTGAIKTKQGLRSYRQRQYDSAFEQFKVAVSHMDAATSTAPTELLPHFLEARARNNLGNMYVRRGQGDAQRQRHLQLVHDRMANILNQDYSNRILTAAQKAQCYYLLAYTHRFLGKFCGGNPIDELMKSYKLLPSEQAAEQLADLQQPVPSLNQRNRFDIWKEFDMILDYWTQRQTTECKHCNVGCSACG